MALSMSVSAGAHNARHNTDLAYRANLRNVDADLSVGNISTCRSTSRRCAITTS